MAKRYDIIYADPPWHYGGSILSMTKTARGIGKSAMARYQTIPTKELVSEFGPMIDSLAKEDAYLAMWVTNTHIPDSLKLAEAAGFEYVTVLFVWDKLSPKVGYYTNAQCEYVFLFKRGKPVKKIGKPSNTKVRQYVGEKRREHSRKPDSVRSMIEDLWKESNRIELFARTQTEGWDTFGNEVNKF